jgi:hypothetical protein
MTDGRRIHRVVLVPYEGASERIEAVEAASPRAYPEEPLAIYV